MEISGDLFIIRNGFLPTANKRYPASMWIYWFPALALTIFVYSTLSVVPDWRESLVSIYGPSMITWGIAIPLGVLFLALAVLSGTREGPKKLSGLMWLAVISVSTGYFLFTIDILVEQVHLIEYGILGWLYYLPLRKIISNRLVFITA